MSGDWPVNWWRRCRRCGLCWRSRCQQCTSSKLRSMTEAEVVAYTLGGYLAVEAMPIDEVL